MNAHDFALTREIDAVCAAMIDLKDSFKKPQWVHADATVGESPFLAEAFTLEQLNKSQHIENSDSWKELQKAQSLGKGAAVAPTPMDLKKKTTNASPWSDCFGKKWFSSLIGVKMFHFFVYFLWILLLTSRPGLAPEILDWHIPEILNRLE